MHISVCISICMKMLIPIVNQRHWHFFRNISNVSSHRWN
uniref:Uncharacterized protein n=1 Tax=Anguilla anguilla TaxID=7936 RepID=A0A0E9PWZ0_ANGAN